MDLVIFDLETTGLSPEANDIIQIAAVRMRGGDVCHAESFATFVDPGYRIPPFITSYTGISDREVRGAPSVAVALSAFARFVGDGTLLAHNGHRFDMPFIQSACAKTRLATRPVPYADSIYLSKLIWGRGGRHGLDRVIDRLGLSRGTFRRHDARGDVGLLAAAVKQMWQQLSPGCTSFPAPLFHGVLPASDGLGAVPTASAPPAAHCR